MFKPNQHGRGLCATIMIVAGIAACAEPNAPQPRSGPGGRQPASPRFETSPALTSSLSPSASFVFRSLPGMTRARAINDAGLVVGDRGGSEVATAWTEAGGYVEVNLLDGSFACCSSLNDVNASGEAVGFSPSPDGLRVMIWSQSTNTRLNTGQSGRGQGINDAGDAVGGDVAFFKPKNGAGTYLQLPPGSASAYAFDINNLGAIVGVNFVNNVGYLHAQLWPRWDMAPVDLGTLGGVFSWAWEVSDAGEVVGFSQIAGGEQHAFLWTSATGMIDLTTWPNGCVGTSTALAINATGIIVGQCNSRPVLWTAAEGMRELPLTGSGATHAEPLSINNHNQIVGIFSDPGIGAALWTLTNSPQAISFTSSAPSGATFGGSYAASAAGGGSGNTVTLSSLSPSVCTVSGSTVSFVGVGICTIAADQAGSPTYAAAPQATQSFTVGKAGQTVSITSSPTNTFYGGSSTITAVGGPSGNAVTFSSLTLPVCTVTGSAVTFVGAGSCTIAADQSGNAFYSPASQVTQTVQVNPGLTALGTAALWIGLKNSDDVGLRVDLHADVLVNGVIAGSGDVANAATGSSGFNNAQLQALALAMPNGPVDLATGANVSLRLSVRRTCSAVVGHTSGIVRFWYAGQPIDQGVSRDAGSRFAASINGASSQFFPWAGSVLGTTAATARTSVDALVNSAIACPARPFTSLGVWTLTTP